MCLVSEPRFGSELGGATCKLHSGCVPGTYHYKRSPKQNASHIVVRVKTKIACVVGPSGCSGTERKRDNQFVLAMVLATFNYYLLNSMLKCRGWQNAA